MPIGKATFLYARCTLCMRYGPATAIDGPVEPLHAAGRDHLARAHPGADLDAIEVEPGRAVSGWDGIEPPHEWWTRHLPYTW
ncbi:hypothetical protein [Streptomyces antimicrobicus]|uniref:Uncharacterized protein n=1 Tax=Streptomyces antimicrobicus TaxID=2883108 RepID=A0ABS8BAH0_9ACTN|nr:hypothetical protein [Streptomyces antimicrobicus]MCB5181509.1 hypothetical protein [Streptomyces antimicrobicus]